MNPLAVVVLGAAALLVHIALCGLATPLLFWAGDAPPLRHRLRAGWREVARAPWQTLAALAGRQAVLSNTASAVMIAAPAVSLGVTVAAALLVPSFATGMLDWPLSDLPLILGLLVAARLVWLAAACDIGNARAGLASVGGTVDALLVLPGLVLAVAVLFFQSGSTVLDSMLAGQRGLAAPGMLLCAGALALAALAAGGRDAILSAELSGPVLAMFRIEFALRRLVWIDLVGGLAWPGSLAPAQSGPLHWLLALLAWLLRLAVGVILLRLSAGSPDAMTRGDPFRRRLAGLCLLAAVLAPVLILAGQKPG